MQNGNADEMEALPQVATPAPAMAPSPLAATPNADDTAAGALRNTPQPQQPVEVGQPAPTATVAPPAASMPPPSTQGATATPTGSGSQAQGQQDPICGYLLQDTAFVAAVKRQDVTQAAQAAAKTIKLNLHAIISRIKPQQNAAMASLLSGNSGPHSHTLPGGPSLGGPVPGGVPSAAPPGYPSGLPGVGLPSMLGPAGGSGERRLSDPDGRFRRGGSCEPVEAGTGRVRELRRGDWVIIRSANKSTDPELLGHDAWVARVEHNGWVELQVPKLGRTVKLQQRYLQLLPPHHPMGLGPAGAPPHALPALQPPHSQQLLGPQPPTTAPSPIMGLLPPTSSGLGGAAPSAVGSRRPMSEASGMGPPGSFSYVDEQGRPYKRPQLYPSVRPALPLEALPPARVASTPSRGSTGRIRDIVRAIRRDLLAIEESIPWNCVTPIWKNTRPGWRRSLQRNVDSQTQQSIMMMQQQQLGGAAAAPGGAAGGAEGAAVAAAVAALVGATAASMMELHDALTTEKGYGLFARRGAWETRLKELADGGNNHACLQVLWAEMAEGIRVWLAGGGMPPPGTPSAAGLPQPAGAVAPYTVRRYYDGLTAGGGDMYGQPTSEDDYYSLAPPPTAFQPNHHHHHQQLPSPFYDFATAATTPAGGGAPRISGTLPATTTAGGVGRGAAGTTAAATAAAAATGGGTGVPAPWVVRSELSLLMQSVESEVDTDLDDGPEATDVELSDSEPLSPIRHRRQQRKQLSVPAPPAETEREGGCAAGGGGEPAATDSAADGGTAGARKDADAAGTAGPEEAVVAAAPQGGEVSAMEVDGSGGEGPPGAAGGVRDGGVEGAAGGVAGGAEVVGGGEGGGKVTAAGCGTEGAAVGADTNAAGSPEEGMAAAVTQAPAPADRVGGISAVTEVPVDGGGGDDGGGGKGSDTPMAD